VPYYHTTTALLSYITCITQPQPYYHISRVSHNHSLTIIYITCLTITQPQQLNFRELQASVSVETATGGQQLYFCLSVNSDTKCCKILRRFGKGL